MINLITINAEGHKVATRINSREAYVAARNTAANVENFIKARNGNDKAKLRLVQFNYNDQLPDGILAGCHTVASTFCHDIDCRDEQECKDIAARIIGMKQKLHLLELSVTPHWGLHAVCMREMGKTILENQVRFSLLTHTEMDTNAHDQQHIFFTGPADENTLLYLDDAIFEESLSVADGQDEYMRMKAREASGEEELPPNYKKQEKHYRPWEQPTAEQASRPAVATPPALAEPQADEAIMLFDHPVADYINTLLPDGAPKGQRHDTMRRLANDLIVLLDNNEEQVKKALLQVQWVRDVVAERGMKEVDSIIDSSKKLLRKREEENFYTPRPSKGMQLVIEQITKRTYVQLIRSCESTLGHKSLAEEETEILLRLGRKLKTFSTYFPLMNLLFYKRKQIHLPAVFFVGGGFGTTLMTRCWYRFYASPGKKCRLNSLVIVMGRPGCGKHFAEDLYALMMEPIKKADQAQIDALNKWNAEREQNSGASKSSTPRPNGIYRCLPSETSAAAIREVAFNAKEVVDGVEWPLHVAIFDSELNHTLSQMKKPHMDAFETLWLKSFHNESGGAMLKTSSAPVGEFPIHFNAVYTGTNDAFKQIATENCYNSGITTRFACVPMGPSLYEMIAYNDYTDEDEKVECQIKEWAYKLDATKGEIPSKELSKALYNWTKNKMEEARDEQSEVLNEMCRRPAWVGINFALPFIVSRHWAEMKKDEADGKFTPGAGFRLDKHDIDLAVFVAQAHYTLQQFFFFELGQAQLEKQKRNGRQPLSRLNLAFRRLPEFFTSADLKREYGYDNDNSVNSCLKRLQDDGRIRRIRKGDKKGMYQKLE